MSNRDNTSGNEKGRKPDFVAYSVRESKDGNGYWNKVGAAWQHRDGQGVDIHLDSLPVNGRVTLRELREERMQGYEDQRQAQSPNREPQRQRERNPDQGRAR